MRRVLTVASIVVCALVGARAATASPPYYVTELNMAAAFEEHGVNHQTVLNAVCQGQGFGHGAFPYTRYHLFLCYLTTRKTQYGQVHVTVIAKNGTWFYSYVGVP